MFMHSYQMFTLKKYILRVDFLTNVKTFASS